MITAHPTFAWRPVSTLLTIALTLAVPLAPGHAQEARRPEPPLFVPPAAALRATLDGKTATATVHERIAPRIAGILVLEDQLADEAGTSGAPSAMAYPFDPNRKRSGRDTRTLFIWGKNLPGPAERADLGSSSRHLGYARVPGNVEALIRQGWEKAAAVEPDVGKKSYSALLVSAQLKPGVTPGAQEISVNEAPGFWPLVFNNQTAVLGFVRERDDPRQFPAHVFYTSDTAFVDLVYEIDMPFPETGLEVELLRRTRDQTEALGVVRARRVAPGDNPTQPVRPTFRAGPLRLYDLAGAPPSPSKDTIDIGVRKGERLGARLYDQFQGLTEPRMALADIHGDPAELGPLWKDALEAVARCRGEQTRVLDDAYAREEATRVSRSLLTSWKVRPRTVPLPLDPFHGITVNRNGVSIGPLVQQEDHDIVLRKGDHAAAILIRDEFVKLSQAMRERYTDLAGDPVSVREFRAAAARLPDASKDPFWGYSTATYPKQGLLTTTAEVELWKTLDAEKRPAEFGQATAQDAEMWAVEATARALRDLVRRMLVAEGRAAAGNCNLEELLVLAGQDARPVVARIVPRLVRKESVGAPPVVQWVPHNLARAFVENLAIAGAAVRALDEYAAIDDAYKAMAVAVATAGLAFFVEAAGAATAAAWILVGGDAVDIAVFGTRSVAQYREGESRYGYALGAAPVLGGDGFLSEAAGARQSGIMTALGLIAPGLGGARGLKQVADLQAVQRGRALLGSGRVSFDDLGRFTTRDREDLAAYYVDLYKRVGKRGVKALEGPDRAAYTKFDDYFGESPAAGGRAMQREILEGNESAPLIDWKSDQAFKTVQSKLRRLKVETSGRGYEHYVNPGGAIDNRLTLDLLDGPRALERATERARKGYIDQVTGLEEGRPKGSVSRKQEEGFFHFRRPDAQRGKTAERIYVNLDADTAPDVMKQIVREIVDRPGEYRGVNGAKIALPTNGAALDRADTIVIYTEGGDATRKVLEKLGQYRKAHPERFLDTSPPMTKRFLPGISTGDEPHRSGVMAWQGLVAKRLGVPVEEVRATQGFTGTSFGSLRANAMYFAWEDAEALRLKHQLTPEQVRVLMEQKTRQYFRLFKIDPDNPNKNLGS